jgi:hypothetical protein
MSTRRQNILSNINAALATISELTTVETNRVLPVIDDATFPIALISSGSETLRLEESELGSELWDWQIPIVVITKTTDIEELLGLIHVKLLTDQTRGGYADLTRRIGSDMQFDADLPSGAQAMTLTYLITYEKTEGSA